jgi:hypothetical protein
MLLLYICFVCRTREFPFLGLLPEVFVLRAFCVYTTRKIVIGGIVFRGVHKFLYATTT